MMMGISLSKALGCTQQLSSDHLLDMRRPDLSQRQILLKYGHDIQGSLSRAPKSKILLSLLRINQCENIFEPKLELISQIQSYVGQPLILARHKRLRKS